MRSNSNLCPMTKCVECGFEKAGSEIQWKADKSRQFNGGQVCKVDPGCWMFYPVGKQHSSWSLYLNNQIGKKYGKNQK